MSASEIFKDFYSSVLSRIGLGCVAIATTAASLPLAGNLIFDSEKTITIATLIGAWIGAEISSYKAAPHQHDVDLRNKLRSLVAPKLAFLRDHDFGGTFDISSVESIREISATWLGTSYQFQDRAIQKQWVPIRQKIGDLSHHIGINAHCVNGSAVLFNFKNRVDELDGLTAATKSNMEKANRLANEIHDGLESLEKLCLKRVGAVSLEAAAEQARWCPIN
jgi:hypothetical protein